MGWEGIHLYQFCLRAARYGSSELSASSSDVTLAALRLRKGARFNYEYDLTIPWRHEVRIEDWLEPEASKTYPTCHDGDGACPPEDCGGLSAAVKKRAYPAHPFAGAGEFGFRWRVCSDATEASA